MSLLRETAKSIYRPLRKIIDKLISPIVYAINPQIIYSQKEFHGSKDRDYKNSFSQDVASLIINPKTVVDIGCGQGIFINALYQRGVDVIGCDISMAAISKTPYRDFVIFQADTTKPVLFNKKFDLCICTEIAEHIPTKCSKVLVENLVNASDIIFFTAAPPGQGGTGHINEQPFEFWVKLFENKRFYLQKEITDEIKRKLKEADAVFWL